MPLFLGGLRELTGARPPTARESGHNSYRAKLGLRLLAHPLDRGEVGAVCGHPERLSARRTDSIDHGADLGLITAVDRHLRAVCGEQPAGGSSDTARATRDHGYLAGQVGVGGHLRISLSFSRS